MLDRPTISECWESCRSPSWRLKTSFNARENTCMDGKKSERWPARSEMFYIPGNLWPLAGTDFCPFLSCFSWEIRLSRMHSTFNHARFAKVDDANISPSRPSREMHFFPYRGSLKEWALREIRLDLNFDASSALKSRVIGCLEAEEENVRKAGNCPILFVPPYKPRFTTARTLLFPPSFSDSPYFSTFNFGVNWPKPWTGNGCVSLLSG